jgi:hypothetical protein
MTRALCLGCFARVVIPKAEAAYLSMRCKGRGQEQEDQCAALGILEIASS